MTSLKSKLIVHCILIVAFFSFGYSQIPDDLDLFKFRNHASLIGPELLRTASDAVNAANGISIDEDTYIVGCGDLFQVVIVESPKDRYRARVGQRGDLYIPDLGIVPLQGLTMREARDSLSSFFRRHLRSDSDIYVELVELKTLTVTLSGAVANPGSFSVPGNLRLLDAIKKANHNHLLKFETTDYRQVLVERNDTKEVQSYDLFQYLFKGDLASNPYVPSKCNIVLNFPRSTILVTGPTVYGWENQELPLLPGETAAELLSLLQFSASVDSGRIAIRKGSSGTTRYYQWEQLHDVELEDGDHIALFSRQNHARYAMAIADGKLVRPGEYPIDAGVTTAADLLERAGGTLATGDVSRAFVLRENIQMSEAEEEEEERITGLPMMKAGTSVMSVNPHVNAALHNLTATGDYTVIPLKSGGEDIILQQNDRLVVPQVETHVYVSGRVRRPGAVSFRPGWSAGKYIRHAGGFARSADRVGVVVMRKYGDRIHTSNVKELEPGDVIVVPEKGTGKNWTLFRETVSIISAFASTILVVITIADRS